jgi:predicted nucleotidyltransferase
MKTLQEFRNNYKSQIIDLAKKYGAYNVRIFGSLARGEMQSNSDIDFLVEFEEQCSLFDQGGLLMDLQDLLNCKVDIVDEQAMHPRFREQVLKESVFL